MEWSIQRSGSDGSSLSLSSMEGRRKFHLGAVCNAQKNMPVRLFNSIFFLLLGILYPM